jgi:hypothetical protein
MLKFFCFWKAIAVLIGYDSPAIRFIPIEGIGMLAAVGFR